MKLSQAVQKALSMLARMGRLPLPRPGRPIPGAAPVRHIFISPF